MKIGRRTFKPKWEAIIAALIVLALIIFLLMQIVGFFTSQFDSRNSLYCSSNSIKIAKELTDKDYSGSETVGDFYAYGENIVLTSTAYDSIGKTNDYANESFKLVNVCNNNEYTLETTNDIDQFLNYGDTVLEEGIYLIYHVHEGTDYTMKMNSTVNESFTTVTSNGTRQQIDLIADSGYFSEIDEAYKLNTNLLMLKVSEAVLDTTIYDIVIDPSYNERSDETYSNDVYSGSNESVALFEMANTLADELKSLGYRVTTTRQSAGEEMLTYGEDSRVGRTIASKAKYYVGLALTGGSGSGASIVHSSYSTSKFADSVKNAMTDSGIVFEENAVVSSSVTNTGYDQTIDLREIGGKALKAGTYSSYTKEHNGMYADIVQGVNGIKFNLGYFNSSDDMKSFEENNAAWAKNIASGIDAYLNPSE